MSGREGPGPFGGLMGDGDPSPRSCPGEAPAVLALHGFTGTPREVDLVVDVAAELGLEAHAPLLPGHGTLASDLAKTGFEDWAAAARAALHDLATPERPAIVVGLSMGAVVAMHLAATEAPRVRALGLLANALRLSWPFPELALDAVRLLRVPDFYMPKKASDIADPEARRTNLTYSQQPVHAAAKLVVAGRAVRRSLSEIRCPTFIAHGALDRVCPVRNADDVARSLGTSERQVLILPRSAHIITRDRDRDLLRRELAAFLRRARGGAQSRPVDP
jgi:carboxylesterase